jgi:hypothetical protein
MLVSTTKKGAPMPTTITLSPTHLDDAIEFCENCGEETNHVSLFTVIAESAQTGYLLECETCMLSWEWN